MKKTFAELATAIAALFTTNGTGAISGAGVKSFMDDCNDKMTTTFLVGSIAFAEVNTFAGANPGASLMSKAGADKPTGYKVVGVFVKTVTPWVHGSVAVSDVSAALNSVSSTTMGSTGGFWQGFLPRQGFFGNIRPYTGIILALLGLGSLISFLFHQVELGISLAAGAPIYIQIDGAVNTKIWFESSGGAFDDHGNAFTAGESEVYLELQKV